MISPSTNLPSLNAQFNLINNRNQLNQIYERLSSGNRINSAKDDAAGLAIAERLLSEMNGFSQAMRNSYDGISAVEVADSYTSGINSDLQRMRELAVQSANGTLSDADRASLNKEFSSLQENIGNSMENAQFNGQKLLTQDGSISIQAGPTATDPNRIDITTQDLSASNDTGIGAVLDSSVNLNTQDGARSALASIDDAMNKVNVYRGGLGATQNRFNFNIQNLQDNFLASTASRSRFADTDYAQETSRQTAAQIREQVSTAILGQANRMLPQMVSSLLRG